MASTTLEGLGDCDALCQFISSLNHPKKDQMLAVLEKLMNTISAQSRLVVIFQDAVDSLDLDVKYLTFDVEVTRRERDYLRRRDRRELE